MEVMTKRESVAAAIMTSLMANDSSNSPDTKHLAFLSVAATDALFDELLKP